MQAVLVMSNNTISDLTFVHDPEITAHMPQSFQLMIQIQQEAEAEFSAIVKDIRAGKITLHEVKKARGMIS